MARPPALRRSSSTAWVALAGASVLWAVLITSAPALASRSERGPLLLSALAYATGSLICHQQPSRSFRTAGVRWPVCARCAGIYLGGTLGLLTGGLLASRSWLWRTTKVRPSHRCDNDQRRRWAEHIRRSPVWFGWTAAAAVPTLASWVLAFAGFLEVSNTVRFALAAPLTAIAGAWLSAALLSRDALH